MHKSQFLRFYVIRAASYDIAENYLFDEALVGIA